MGGEIRETYLGFVTWHIILLYLTGEAAIRRWIHRCHERMDMVSNQTQVDYSV